MILVRSVLSFPGLLAVVHVLLLGFFVVAVATRLDSPRPETVAAPGAVAAAHLGRSIHGRLGQRVDGGILVLARDLPPSLDVAVLVGWTDVWGDSFHLEGIDEPGLYTVFLRGAGTDWSRIPVYVKESPVDLGVVELVSDPTLLYVAGSVKDDQGHAIEGARVDYAVAVSCYYDMCFVERLTASTNAAGAFFLFPYDPDIRLEVGVTADGYRGQDLVAKWGDRLEITMAPVVADTR